MSEENVEKTLQDIGDGLKNIEIALGQMHAQALYKNAIIKATEDDFAGFLENMIEAVNHGFKGDYSLIGTLYLAGKDDVKQDTNKARYWFERFYRDYENGQLELDDKSRILSVLYNLGLLTMVYAIENGENKDGEYFQKALAYWRRAVQCYDNNEYDKDYDSSSALNFYNIGCIFAGYKSELINDKCISIDKELNLAVRALTIASDLGFEEANTRMNEIANSNDMGSVRSNSELMEKDHYYYVNLISLSDNIIREPSDGYFSFLSGIKDNENIVTYKVVLTHHDLYIKKAIDKILESLQNDEREALIIKKKFGIDNDKPDSFREIGRSMQLSAERIRQIYKHTIRKCRHPARFWRLGLASSLFTNKNYEVISELNFGEYFEKIIARECEYYLHNKDADITGFFSENIIKESYGTAVRMTDSIACLELSVRTYNCLYRAGIQTVGDLLTRTKEELMMVRQIGHKSLQEALDKVSEISGNAKEVPSRNIVNEDGSLNSQNGILITRTTLSSQEMLNLLGRGFLYVEDFLVHYERFHHNEDGVPEYILKEDSIILKKLLAYSEPMLRVNMPENLLKEMDKRDLKSIQGLIDIREELSPSAQASLDKLFELISDKKEEYNITVKRGQQFITDDTVLL